MLRSSAGTQKTVLCRPDGRASSRVVRHTTFRYRMDPSADQETLLRRHAGASRFAFNQALRLHLGARVRGAERVPWSGFDLINAFNAWKKTEDAGRVFSVAPDGTAETVVTGLRWRGEVCQQVFEEACVDLGRGLGAWTDSLRGRRKGRKVGHPRFKRKTDAGSFRLRNKLSERGRSRIRVGDCGHARSVSLPVIGTVAVFDDTRRLRRLIARDRARIMFATVREHAGRWWISLNVEAADLHPGQRHPTRPDRAPGGWVGIDRGLHAFVVAATSDGREVLRTDAGPRPLINGLARQRQLAKDVTRKPRGSRNRQKAARKLGRHHHRVTCARQHFLHQLSNCLVKTHDRTVIEDLNIQGMLHNPRLARSISDAAWDELARQLAYKQAWRGGKVMLANRWLPSSKSCSQCGQARAVLRLSERVFQCDACGASLDRDLNAAINLAAWAEAHDARARDRQADGPVTNAHREARSGQRPQCVGETGPGEVGRTCDPEPLAA